MSFSLRWLLLLQSTGSRHAGSIVVAHRLTCFKACGIFSEQGSNLCPLHCKAESLPLDHHRSSWKPSLQVSQSVQSLSHVHLFATPWTAAHQASLSIIKSRRLLKLMSIVSVMPSNYLISSSVVPFSHLHSFPASGFFSSESVLRIRWPKYWSFSFSISPSSEYSGLISFRMDWLDLLAVQGTLKSLLQHHSLEASILWRSAFFIV